MILRILRARRTFLHECSSRWVRRATSCRLTPRIKSFAKEVCETIGPVDNELSKVHEAGFHVLSDSVIFLGKQALDMPEIKFTEGWKEHVGYCKDTKNFSWNQIQFVFHLFFGAKTNEMVLKLDEWMRQGQGRDGLTFSPEICFHRVIFI